MAVRKRLTRKADKRPVWGVGNDRSNPQIIESLRYQTTIDGSRAPWRARIDIADRQRGKSRPLGA